jgi:membrane protein
MEESNLVEGEQKEIVENAGQEPQTYIPLNAGPGGGFESFSRVKSFVKTFLQRIFLTVQLFGDNSLANHAAAGAYGFLMSAAPVLLMASFLLFVSFRSSPHIVIDWIKNQHFLDIVFDEDWLNQHLFSTPLLGISGVISAVSVFWAGRIFALSIQRGLKIIYPGIEKESAVRMNLVMLAIEATALVLALVMILGSGTALQIYNSLKIIPDSSFIYFMASLIQSHVFPSISLWLIAYLAYTKIPYNSPTRISSMWGSIFFVLLFKFTSVALGILLMSARYNFLYGALGNLIILLVNVYFFFVFFFLGAQYAYVLDSFEALLFSKLRKYRSVFMEAEAVNNLNASQKIPAAKRLFTSVDGHLKKYLRNYKQGDTIFVKGDVSDEIYYILEGEINLALPMNGVENYYAVLGSGSFFGEMSHLLSEARSATAIAKTDIAVLALPPEVFDELIKFDTSLDRNLIQLLSRRLKITNERLANAES